MQSLEGSIIVDLNSDSVIRNERIYLHIYDYETKEFSELTTYHGLVRIYNSNTWPSRIFWCVVVISCLSMFMTHVIILGLTNKEFFRAGFFYGAIISSLR